jgi:hypothetical protein
MQALDVGFRGSLFSLKFFNVFNMTVMKGNGIRLEFLFTFCTAEYCLFVALLSIG